MSGRRSLQAPKEDGGILVDPPLSEVGRLLEENRRRFAAAKVDILGMSLADYRQVAQDQALAIATGYLRQAGEPVPSINTSGLLLAGHQPELLHPGVWVKNFALTGLARAHGLTPLNLVVDNDLVKSTALHLPVPRSQAEKPFSNPEPAAPARVTLAGAAGSESGLETASQPNRLGDGVQWHKLPFDEWTGEAPYEEREVKDEALFASFAERAADKLRGWNYDPMLPAFWAEVRRQAERTRLLGERFASARRSFERAWGCHNLELPVSQMCRGIFYVFAFHILQNLQRFNQVYNEALRDYRRQHRIRSKNHPVPYLVTEDDWYEVPFWGWGAGQSRRGRLLARDGEFEIDLRVGSEPWPGPPRYALSYGTLQGWVSDLADKGLKIRPRALTTTLFARLFLADLFIHGIGGALYDQLTDEIIRRFYGIEPPAYLVVSATLHLPLPTFPVGMAERNRLGRETRDMQWNPQRFLGASAHPEVRRLLEQKDALIRQLPAEEAGKRQRFQTLRALTERLRPFTADQGQETRRQLEEVDRRLQVNAILQRRDYAFCLYPEDKLRALFNQPVCGVPLDHLDADARPVKPEARVSLPIFLPPPPG